jgi:hypothetical protein
VESSVCEIEEATFAKGTPFDIHDDMRDEQSQDVELLKKALTEEFQKNKVRSAVNEVLINAAVYGTGVAEVVTEEVERKRPATESVMDGSLTAYGVYTENKVAVTLRPVVTKNFYIDPVSTSIPTAHGCAIDEFVPHHQVISLQKSGVYRECYLGTSAPESDLEPDAELNVYPQEDKVRILKYFGLVPRYMIELANMSEEELSEKEPPEGGYDGDDLVEAIVVIGNEGVLLKAEESPYMMQDRPVVAFQWDTIPGLFHGRGVVEKAYNPQKALDAEIRARIDALALTVHPMMAMDATRIPRGHKPEVRAGKTILTNGAPKDVLMPFKLGDVSQITFAQAAELQGMVQQATGAIDGMQFASDMGSNNKTGAVSMALGSIIKRQKRTLVNFQDNFWMPFVEKSAWRYMQFDPENFPVKDYNFVPVGTLGIMAREYEVSQLIQLLQTASDKSPMYGAIVTSIVGNMNLSNREELIAQLEEAAKPNQEEVQRQREMHELEKSMKQGQVKYVHAQAFESQARGRDYIAEAEERPKLTKVKMMDAVNRDMDEGEGDSAEFNRRLEVAEFRLREREQNRREFDSETQRITARTQASARDELDDDS